MKDELMKNSDADTIRNDRIVLFASENEIKKLDKQINWKQLAIDVGLKIIGNNIGGIVWNILQYNFSNNKNDIFSKYKKKSPYKIMDINALPLSLKFPPQHPIDGVLYASCDCEPNYYVPFSDFHTYMSQCKMSEFIYLCANLGAKDCRIMYAEENGKNITAELQLKNILTEAGDLSIKQKFSLSKKKEEKNSFLFTFPRPINDIRETQSLWLNGEPSWRMLQKLRLENDVQKSSVDCNYSDEMGITTALATSLSKAGFNLGGTFKKINKTKYTFDVDFWPKKK